MLLNLDVGTGPDGLHQSTLNLSAGVVGMVQNAELGVAALTMEVELAVFLAVEIDAPLYEFVDLLGSHTHNLLYGLTVADEVTGNDGVGNMLVEGVELQIGDTGNASLGKRGVGLVEGGLANHTYSGVFVFGIRLLGLQSASHLQGVAHSSHASTDNQEIVLIYHGFLD